jgi:hypothetical protein
MHVRRMGITGLAGSTAGSLSELVRGSAAALDSGRDLDLGDLDLVVADLTAGVGLMAAVSRDVERLAVDSAAERHEVVAFTAEAASMVAVAVSMVEAVRTVEAVTAADTGKS